MTSFPSVALAYLHLLSIGLTVSFIVAEATLYRARMSAERARLIQKLDMGYFVAAMLILATGFTRALWLEKGWPYYWGNVFFHLKLGAYLLWALASLVPTFHFLGWSKRLVQGSASIEIEPIQFRRVRAFIWLQLGLACLVPLFAVLMARGYGFMASGSGQ